MYKQLHMIKHINIQFVVLHTCTQTFHTWHSEMHKKSLDMPITTKDNTIEPFLIRSVRCKHKHFWLLFLFSPLVWSFLTTAVVCILSGSGIRYALKFLIEASTTSIWAPNITKNLILSLCRRICPGLNCPPPVYTLFCLQLAQRRNCDAGPKRV